MIHESSPWKRQLLKDADLLERWAKAKPGERRSFIFEQKVFLAAYTMRKLFEAQKLSSALDGTNVRVEIFALLPGRELNPLSIFHLDKDFNFEASENGFLNARQLLDVIIHSYIYCECEDETTSNWLGFFLTSEKHQKTLWYVKIEHFIDLMRSVGSDDVSVTHIAYNAAGKFLSWRGANKLPVDILRRSEQILQG